MQIDFCFLHSTIAGLLLNYNFSILRFLYIQIFYTGILLHRGLFGLSRAYPSWHWGAGRHSPVDTPMDKNLCRMCVFGQEEAAEHLVQYNINNKWFMDGTVLWWSVAVVWVPVVMCLSMWPWDKLATTKNCIYLSINVNNYLLVINNQKRWLRIRENGSKWKHSWRKPTFHYSSQFNCCLLHLTLILKWFCNTDKEAWKTSQLGFGFTSWPKYATGPLQLVSLHIWVHSESVVSNCFCMYKIT